MDSTLFSMTMTRTQPTTSDLNFPSVMSETTARLQDIAGRSLLKLASQSRLQATHEPKECRHLSAATSRLLPHTTSKERRLNTLLDRSTDEAHLSKASTETAPLTKPHSQLPRERRQLQNRDPSFQHYTQSHRPQQCGTYCSLLRRTIKPSLFGLVRYRSTATR